MIFRVAVNRYRDESVLVKLAPSLGVKVLLVSLQLQLLKVKSNNGKKTT